MLCYYKDGEPLTSCPVCGTNLTKSCSVQVALSVGDLDFLSNLDTGVLDDPDELLDQGLHSDTCCVRCKSSLSEYGEKLK